MYRNVDEWSVQDRKVALTVPTIGLGVVAVAASTCAVTMLTSQSTPSSTANKFATRPVAPSRASVAGRTQPRMAFEFGEEAGVLPPTGYLDPLGFGEAASPERLRWFREAEVKHGRIAMLAAAGFLTAENPDLKDAFFPGQGSDLASHVLTDHKLDGFWYAFFAGVGALEVRFFDKFDSVLDWKLKKDYAVGDLGFDPLAIKPTDPEAYEEIRTKELQNGRLAMLALAGANAQEMTDGKPVWPIHGLSGASAEELNSHLEKGLELVKEMGQMLAETSAVTSSH